MNKNILDLIGIKCPLNYIKVKLYLENIEIGDMIEIYLDDGDPIQNVPNSLKNDGHEIIEIKQKDHYYVLIIRKNT